MRSLTIPSLLAVLLMVGCAAYGGATLLDVPVIVSAPPGFAVASPDAIQSPEGTRFHGSVCRRSFNLSATRIRVERIDAGGAVVASASRPLWGLGGRVRHCTFYDVPTDWTVGAGEHVRVCALRSDAPCGRTRP